MNAIVFGYISIINLFCVFDKYIRLKIDLKKKEIIIDKDSFDFLKLFEIFKSLKNLTKELLEYKECLINFNPDNKHDSPKHLSSAEEYAQFYYKCIENVKNYSGCIKTINQYQNFQKIKNSTISESNFELSFGSQLEEAKLNYIGHKYINDYYEHEETKVKRVYRMEHAGLNWTQEDMDNFDEGMRRFGHLQLANIKIAKFMGVHIEPSHVKLFRSQISRETRTKRREEKASKIQEMKKNKNSHWKPLEENSEYNLL